MGDCGSRDKEPLITIDAKGTMIEGARMSELQERLLHKGFVNANRSAWKVRAQDSVFMNRMIVFSWPLFAAYLCSQPWLSNYANNTWFDYSAEYTVYARDGSIKGSWIRPGMCDTPAEYFHCTDGQNFTELALKYRGKAVGCGCGQGFLGEGLCPMTSYGYTLSDFVSTEPGIAAMLGLGFFPLLGTWRNTLMVNILAKPSKFYERVHTWSMAVFQISYVLWGVCSDCIFPTGHSVLTVVFLAAIGIHWIITALICVACLGLDNIESLATLYVAGTSITVITLGAIPRIFLTLNTALDVTWFPNWNYGIGAYAFWAAEAGGLSLTFGAYPIILVVVWFFPHLSDVNKDGQLTHDEESLFALSYFKEEKKEVADAEQPIRRERSNERSVAGI
jgi:hypothetical protein